MITIFDTETTGFIDWNKPVDHEAQPRLVQIGAILCDDGLNRRAHLDVIIHPNDVEIPESAAKLHGITTAIASQCGVSMVTALAMFAQFTSISHTIVGWNCEFDSRVVSGAFLRAKLPKAPFTDSHKWRDVMKECTPILKLPPTRPGQKDWKYPELSEAHQFFFKEDFKGAHSALNDCFATLKIMREIDRLRGPKHPNLI